MMSLYSAVAEMTYYTKRQLANHIRDLFARCPETLRAVRWACVIKDGKLTVVTRLSVRPTDFVIVECLLEPSLVPPWLLIYYNVWRNWGRLIKAGACRAFSQRQNGREKMQDWPVAHAAPVPAFSAFREQPRIRPNFYFTTNPMSGRISV
jgi:hypothetical protein